MEPLQNVVRFFEDIFPSSLALPEDRVGLQVQAKDTVDRVMVALELNPQVLKKATRERIDLLYLHHPPLWEPLSRLSYLDPLFSMLAELYFQKISVLAHHTNLDLAPGGIADQWVKLLGLEGSTKPLLPVIHGRKYKIVTFVPPSHLDEVLRALFAQGAGIIGNYEECAFLLPGTGTFLPRAEARPFIGTPGQRETVEEIRVEVEVMSSCLEKVLEALHRTHPYEQPVVDVYPLVTFSSSAGLGRTVHLSSPLPWEAFEERIASLAIPRMEFFGERKAVLQKIALCPGSGRRLVTRVIEERADLFISGDLTHHDVETLCLSSVSYLHLPHGEGERRALRELVPSLREQAQKKGLKVSILFEEDVP
uniref:GTP cyclohydrolase 1 type 2 homolog n=1 Tax=Candidatus Caldatribacterium saccharofermentans TaxID=1454753 RepID=A0A7V4THY9_9BACT